MQSLLKLLSTLSAAVQCLFGLWFGLLLSLHTACGQTSLPDQHLVMYGHSDNAGATDAFREDVVPAFTVIEGTSSNASFIKELRDQGKVYAAHVNNIAGESASQLLARWRAPFQNTIGGQLPGGYDAIAIDELLGASTNGTANSNAVVSALGQLRNLYPDKGIYAATTWHYGSQSGNYTDQLNALNTYADLVMVENYLREDNYSYSRFSSYADNLKSAVPGILDKSVYGLYIPQGGYVADTSTDVGFWGFLDDQLHRIRNDADARTMPGVMFWPYYRSEQDLTPDYVSRLVDHYYVQENTSFFGDGGMEQLITNPQFEGNTNGWSLSAGSGGSIQRFNYSSVSIKDDHDNFGQTSHGSAGLKMIRGSTPNEAAFRVNGLDPNMVYTVSAFVISPTANQRAQLAVTELDGTLIELEESYTVGSPPDYYHKWDEWSRLDFHFVPTASSINVVLRDGTTAYGTTLYWDFVELEAAYPVDTPPPANTDFTWVGTSFGSWETSDQWSPAGVPDGNNMTARFADSNAANMYVRLNQPQTVQQVHLDEASSYSLIGSGSLQLDTDSVDPQLVVNGGNHRWTAPVNALANTTIDVASGASLALDNTFGFNGVTVTKQGSGTLLINGPEATGSGSLNVTEGTLSGDGVISGSINISGGAVAPGSNTGSLYVKNNFTLGSAGVLQIDLGSSSTQNYDSLNVSGVANLAGTIDVTLLDNYEPVVGQSFLILTANQIVDQGLVLSDLDADQFDLHVYNNAVVLESIAPELAGDYNLDGIVDAADYTVWRDTLGWTNVLLADGNHNGMVDYADYLVWKLNFGSTGSAQATAADAVVPEPSSVGLLAGLLTIMIAASRDARFRVHSTW
jgi:autotransporter-associated beta strand protein